MSLKVAHDATMRRNLLFSGRELKAISASLDMERCQKGACNSDVDSKWPSTHYRALLLTEFLVVFFMLPRAFCSSFSGCVGLSFILVAHIFLSTGCDDDDDAAVDGSY